MWGESSKTCENNCQCSGLITDSFTINSKRRDEALTSFKYTMSPHCLKSPSRPSLYQENRSPNIGLSFENQIEASFDTCDFARSPNHYKSQKESPRPLPFEETISFNTCEYKSPFSNPTPRKVLGELQNTFKSPNQPTPKRKFTPVASPVPKRVADLNTLTRSPLFQLLDSPKIFNSPVTSQRSFKKITRIFEERKSFKMDKENIDKFEEETSDTQFHRQENWTATKLDFTDVLASSYKSDFKTEDTFVPEKEELDPDFETLHDLEEEFDNDNFDQCTKYEIISTDSPDIISRGRSSSNRKINGSFEFGAPLADTEQSTSFNRPARALNFEDSFDFPSPVIKKSSSSGSVKKSLKFNETPTKDSMKRIFTSESTTSMESGFVSEFDDQLLDIEESNSPKVANFDNLLSGTIKNDIVSSHQPLCRSKSFNPAQSKARVSLLSILESPQSQKRRQKRSEPIDCGENKRRKCEEGRPVLQRCFSETHATIMTAFDRLEQEPELIGDFSQPFALPLARGPHADLKAISCDTLAALMRGEYDTVTDFQVIDCRYPYEYAGGHVAGARNLYTRERVRDLLTAPPPTPPTRRVLVFHCEFSLERGPNMYRFLRSIDRELNKDVYPSLHYPEVYLLHEGYRAFHQRHPSLCSPAGYTAMLDPKHREQLKQYRAVHQPSSQYRKNRLLF